VPVLGEKNVVEALGEGVDGGDDGVAFFYFERASGAEVILEIDDEESVRVLNSNHGLNTFLFLVVA
jgi:hypothetical protein